MPERHGGHVTVRTAPRRVAGAPAAAWEPGARQRADDKRAAEAQKRVAEIRRQATEDLIAERARDAERLRADLAWLDGGEGDEAR